MIRTPRAVRTLVLITVLLAGCTSTDASATAGNSPTAPSDPMAAAACAMVVRAGEEQAAGEQLSTILDSLGASQRAIMSSDPAIQEAGRRLVPIGKQAGDLFVKKQASTVEMEPSMQQLEEARRGLISACTDLFGPQPWPLTRLPSPEASN